MKPLYACFSKTHIAQNCLKQSLDVLQDCLLLCGEATQLIVHVKLECLQSPECPLHLYLMHCAVVRMCIGAYRLPSFITDSLLLDDRTTPWQGWIVSERKICRQHSHCMNPLRTSGDHGSKDACQKCRQGLSPLYPQYSCTLNSKAQVNERSESWYPSPRLCRG